MRYRVGKVNTSTKTIDWVLRKSTFFGRGKYPAVALSNKGKVVIVHQSFSSSKCYYLVGKLNSVGPSDDELKPSIIFLSQTEDGASPQLFPHVRDGLSQLSIAINGSEWLIIAGKVLSHYIIYIVGQLIDCEDDTCVEIKWSQNAALENMLDSSYPSVGLDDDGHVISLQQTKKSLTYRVGKIELEGDEVTNVAWSGDKREYRNGSVPVIGVSNDGRFIVEEHEANTVFESKLLYCIGNLIY